MLQINVPHCVGTYFSLSAPRRGGWTCDRCVVTAGVKHDEGIQVVDKVCLTTWSIFRGFTWQENLEGIVWQTKQQHMNDDRAWMTTNQRCYMSRVNCQIIRTITLDLTLFSGVMLPDKIQVALKFDVYNVWSLHQHLGQSDTRVRNKLNSSTWR